MNYAKSVIAIALAEDGYLEKASNSQLDSKTANPGSKNYTKYGRDMHAVYPSVMDFPAAWCDAFVDWCFYKAYGVATAKSLIGGNFDDYTFASAQMYKNKGAYHKSNPKVGDQIFFNNGTRICHTGLVVKVTSSTVYTIEGNTSSLAGVVANGGCVRQKSYSISYAKIDGYGRPKYDVETSGTSGGSSASASTVKVESASKKDSSLAGTYKTTANLNLRAGAGTTKSILVTIPKGTSVKNYGYYTPVGNTKWLYVAVTVAGKQYTGFCSKAYLTK